MTVESNFFAMPFAQTGAFAEGTFGPVGVFRLPVDVTLLGVSCFARGAGTVALQVDIDEGVSGILEKILPAGGTRATLYGRGDFGPMYGLEASYQAGQYPHITREHSIAFLTNVESGAVSEITVVFYFLAG
jgi:hypothetical protein